VARPREKLKGLVDGKTYNTDTATKVARWDYKDENQYDTDVTLYQTNGGAFFAVHEWTTQGNQYTGAVSQQKTYWETLTRDEVDKLLMSKDGIEVLNDSLDTPPEAVNEEEPAATIYLRIPPALKRSVDAAAVRDGVSVNTWGIRALEDRLTSGMGIAAAAPVTGGAGMGAAETVLHRCGRRRGADAMRPAQSVI